MTVGIEGLKRLGVDAGWGRQVTMRDGISALNSVRDPPDRYAGDEDRRAGREHPDPPVLARRHWLAGVSGWFYRPLANMP
jgi:hypothetical protein